MKKNTTTTNDFFVNQKEKSRIKTFIVTEFFKAYFPIIYNSTSADVWYLDLFCGPGIYEDGNKSTPLVLLDVINQFKNNSVREHIKLVFNDHNSNYTDSLRSEIEKHPVMSKLKYKPSITCLKASQVDLSKYTSNNLPIFSFVDPWGYKDVSTAQVWQLVKNRGSDCVLFFNANRILQDINKPANEKDFSDLFGEYFSEAKQLQHDKEMTQREKADKYLSLFSKNLYVTVKKERKKNKIPYSIYILPFYVEADDKDKISHYIVFITKSHKAIQEMRKVMLKCGNSTSETLGYDDKYAMQIKLFSRDTDLFSSITAVIKKAFFEYPKQHQEYFTIEKLSDFLDRYSMYNQYRTLSYSSSELKTVIEQLDKRGCIEVVFPVGKKIRKRITDDREFRINSNIKGV